jgi:hypothetical protein
VVDQLVERVDPLGGLFRIDVRELVPEGVVHLLTHPSRRREPQGKRRRRERRQDGEPSREGA